MKEINKINSFGRFCYTIGMIPASYKESLTYEEQLLWFCNFLENTVIPTVNNNGLAVEELQNLYVELKNYVDNYFENLDIQEEINNKLDEMAEDGTLAEIIGAYLEINGVLAFNTVNEMKNATNLIEGSTCQTLGLNTFNDGFGRLYKIVKILSPNPEDIDGINLISLGRDALYAQIINNDVIEKVNSLNELFLSIDNFKKEENEETDTERIQRAIDFLNENEGGSLYFPNGEYSLNDTIILYPNIRLIGESINGVIIKGEFNKSFFEIADKTKRNDNIEISYMTFHKDIIDNNTPIIDLTSIGYSLIKNVSFYNFTQAYESIGVLLGALSYYNVIQDCQFRGFNIGISFINEANGNLVRGGTCISCVNGIDISHSNTNRIIGHSCEILTGTAYFLHDHSLQNIIIAPRIENCQVGFKTEFKANGQSSFSNMLIAPEFYLEAGQTQYINPVSNGIIDNYTWADALNRATKANFKATKKYGQLLNTANTPTKITFAQTSWNNMNYYNTSSDRFIANKTATYFINSQINMNNIVTGEIIKLMIYVNGNPAVTKTIAGVQYDIRNSLCITSLLNLSENDYVEIFISSSSSSSHALLNETDTYFEGYEI